MIDLKNLFFSYRSFTPIPIAFLIIYLSDFNLEQFLAGIALITMGELIRIRSVQFAGGRTRTRNVGAPSLCTSGPYAKVRNPLYLGNMLIYIGICFVGGGNYFFEKLVLILSFFTIQYSMIVSLEEETLTNLFGNEYKDYCKNVPRIIPKFKPWISNEIRSPNSLLNTLRTERRTLQNILGMITIILFKSILA